MDNPIVFFFFFLVIIICLRFWLDISSFSWNCEWRNQWKSPCHCVGGIKFSADDRWESDDSSTSWNLQSFTKRTRDVLAWTSDHAFLFFYALQWNLSLKYLFFAATPSRIMSNLGPNIHWTSNYGTGIVFIGKMVTWLSFHNFVWWSLNAHISIISPNIWDLFSKSNSSIYYL